MWVIIVGGKNSYDFGNYLNSSLESILPVYSQSLLMQDTKSIVILLDASVTTSYNGAFEEIKKNTIEIVEMNYFDNIGIGVISGSKTDKLDLLNMHDQSNKEFLIREIEGLQPTNRDMYRRIDLALSLSSQFLANVNGLKEIVLISDGLVWGDETKQKIYKNTRMEVTQINKNNISVIFVQVKTTSLGKNKYYSRLAEDSNTFYIPLNDYEYLNKNNIVKLATTIDSKTHEVSLITQNSNNTIIKNFNKEFYGNISGFNPPFPG